MAKDFNPHLFITKIHTSKDYKVPPRKINQIDNIPKRDRYVHGTKILSELESIWGKYEKEKLLREKLDLPIKEGEYFTFKSAADNNLSINSLDSSGANLLNVKYSKDSNEEIATIYIPSSKKNQLIKKVEKYSDTEVVERFNNELVARIESVDKSTIENFWSSPIEFIPKEDAIWCELWISGGSDLFEEVEIDLFEVCDFLGIDLLEENISFAERTVVAIKANYDQLEKLVMSFGYIAELRKSQEWNSFWLNLETTIEREDWIESAIESIEFNNNTNNYISILDTGVNNGHKLIAPVLDDADKLTVNVNWGTNDTGKHGTRMAGVAAYGDLNAVLESTKEIIVEHRIESVKIFPPTEVNEDSHLPFITENAVNIATINKPDVKRIFCFANTGKLKFDFGKPSSWSAVIDALSYGYKQFDKKLFVISVGNVRDSESYKDYPKSNFNSQVESPAQSWNAISVGAYTQKIFPDKDTVASRSELSPFSRTSVSWENSWPIKPEVVFEGGNLLRLSNNDVHFHEDLEVLTTSNLSATNEFTTINATSAATAFASNFLAKLRSVYPSAWEETLRGLMIHSSSWTESMKEQLNFNGSQNSILEMLRTYGYGVPNFKKASSCKTNYLTFVLEEVIQPYIKAKGRIKTKDIHFYEFPWPEDVLKELGSIDATVRVTLSYFIEPNPGDKGYSNNYSYQSVGLRFALMPPNDSPDNFMLRINEVAREELKNSLGLDKLPEGEIEKVKNVKWALGADNVFKGSVHSNYWNTSAAEVSSCKYIAVYPMASGWWKKLKKQKKYNSKLRYSLIVSIETPENTQDIYTDIAQKVKLENLIKV